MAYALYGQTTRSHRIAASARFAGVADEDVVQAACVMGETNKSATYLKEKNPFGKVPCLENVERGTAAFESNAIARYFATVGSSGASIYPKDAWTRARIDGWMDSFNVVDVCGPHWLYPIVGIGAARGIVYDEKKGFLYFNEDGKERGWGDGGLFAKLQGAPELTQSDFTIV